MTEDLRRIHCDSSFKEDNDERIWHKGKGDSSETMIVEELKGLFIGKITVLVELSHTWGLSHMLYKH